MLHWQPKDEDEEDLSGDELKNAVVAIHGLCQSEGWSLPHYKLVNNVDPDGICTVRCQVLTYNEFGKGATQNLAKVDAARKMKERLLIFFPKFTHSGNMFDSASGKLDNGFASHFHGHTKSPTSLTSTHNLPLDLLEKCTSDPETNEKHDINLVTKNAVTELANVCQFYNWPPPLYHSNTGKSPEQSVIVTCGIQTYFEKGCGKSETEAKEKAAIKILQKLNADSDPSSGEDVTSVHSFKINSTEHVEPLLPAIQKSFKAVHISDNDYKSYIINNDAEPRGKRHRARRDLMQGKLGHGCQSGHQLPEFCVVPPSNKQYIWLLKSVASKLQFEVEYENVSSQTSTSKYQCLVHLCRDPPVVCYGMSKSPAKARSAAARCAFEYLKTIYKYKA